MTNGNGSSRHPARHALRCCAVAFLLLSPHLRAAEERYWETFPKPPGRSDSVSCIGLDEENGLWAMAGNGCYYWDVAGKEWVGPVLSAGAYLTRLYGTPESGLYATQQGEEHAGGVYRLVGGKAQHVTTFRYDTSTSRPRFHVSLGGRLVNWAGGKLRVYAAGRWIEADADLPQAGMLIFDRGETISLYAKGTMYVIDQQNSISRVEVDGQVNRKATKGVLWGKDSAIVLEYGSPGVHAFDVRTGKRVDLGTTVNRTLGERSVRDLFRRPDGSVSVSVVVADRELESYLLYRVAPDGTTEKMIATAGLPWVNCQLLGRTCSVVTDTDGALWFASYTVGIFRLRDGEIRQFDHRADGSPAAPVDLLCDSAGIVYASGFNGVHAYNNGVSLTGVPRLVRQPLSKLGEAVWQHDMPIGQLHRAWYVDGLLFLSDRRGRAVRALDAATGEPRFSIPGGGGGTGDSHWVSRECRDGQAAVCMDGRILTVESGSGEVVRTVTSKRDARIAPVPMAEGYVLVPENRGSYIARVDAAGETIWKCRLPGYVITHPSAYGALLVAQTRGSSYGGQATSGIDLATGSLLWSDKVDAYGCGVVFADDARYSVEGDTRLGPKGTAGRLICRDPRNGTMRWTYRRPQTMLNHAPLLDPVTDRVYAVFEDGTTVCVDAKDGKALWRTTLHEKPLRTRGASYDPYQSCLALDRSLFFVTDADGTLHVLEVGTGKVMERIALTRDTIRHGNISGRPELVAAPTLAGDLLIVPTVAGIRAYAHDFSKHRPEGNPPTLAWLKPAPKRTETGTITLALKAGSDGEGLVARYRYDDGGWQKETLTPPEHSLTIRHLDNGPHSCRIQVYDQHGRSSNELVHRFEVDCDYEAMVADLVAQLGGKRYRERERAETRLLEMGAPIRRYLEKHRSHKEPEVRMRVERVLKGLTEKHHSVGGTRER